MSVSDEALTYIELMLRLGVDYMKTHPNNTLVFTDFAHIKSLVKKRPTMQYNIGKVLASGQLDIAHGAFTQPDWKLVHYTDALNNIEYGRKQIEAMFGYMPNTAWEVHQKGTSRTALKIWNELGYTGYAVSHFPREIINSLDSTQDRLFGYPDDAAQRRTLVLATEVDIDPPDGHAMPSLSAINDILQNNFNLADLMTITLNEVDKKQQSLKTSLVPWPNGGRRAFFMYKDYVIPADATLIFVKCNNLSGRYRGEYNITHSTATRYFTEATKEIIDKKVVLSGPLPNLTDPSDLCDVNALKWVQSYSSSPSFKRSAKSFGQTLRSLKSLLAIYLLKFPSRFGFDVDTIIEESEARQILLALAQGHRTLSGESDCKVLDGLLSSMKAETAKVKATWKNFLGTIVKPGTRFVNQDQLLYEVITPEEDDSSLGKGSYLVVSQDRAGERLVRVRSLYPFIQVANEAGDLYKPLVSTCLVSVRCEHLFNITLNAFEAKAIYITSQPFAAQLQFRIVVALEDGKVDLRQAFKNQVDDVRGNTVPLITEVSSVEISKNGTRVIIYLASGRTLEMGLCSDIFTCSPIKEVGVLLFEDFKSIVIQYLPIDNSCWFEVFILSFGPPDHRISSRTGCKDNALSSGFFSKTKTVHLVISSVEVESDAVPYNDENGLLETVSKATGDSICSLSPATSFAYLKSSNGLAVFLDRSQAVSFYPKSTISLRVSSGLLLPTGSFCEEKRELSVLHYIYLGPSPEDWVRRMQTREDSPLLILSLSPYPINKVEILEFGLSTSISPVSDYLKVEFDARTKDEIMMRVHNMHSSRVESIDFKNYLDVRLKIPYVKVVETSLDFNDDFSPAKRDKVLGITGKVLLNPLQIRTFWIIQ
jgi:hypothetical protein